MLQLPSYFDDMSTLTHMDVSSLDELIRETMSQIYDDPLPDIAQLDEKPIDQSVLVNNDHTPNNVHTPNNDQKETEGAVFAVPQVYICMYCGKRFYNKNVLRKHQVNHAKMQLKCKYCKMKSYNIHTLRRHYAYFHVFIRNPYVLIQAWIVEGSRFSFPSLQSWKRDCTALRLRDFSTRFGKQLIECRNFYSAQRWSAWPINLTKEQD